ncbi:MAG: hypothetical protein ACP5U2_09770 [Bryobacteraceae bacterium]
MSFDSSPEGLEAFARVLGGQFLAPATARAPHVRQHVAVLTHGFRRQALLEVNMPFAERMRWTARLEALAGATAEVTLDGRLVVRAATSRERGAEDVARNAMNLTAALAWRPSQRDARFDLSWSWQASFTAAQARLDLAPLLATYRFEQALGWLDQVLPRAEQIGVEMSLSAPGPAAAAWLDAPIERSSNYKEVYAEMSVAVQQALRVWLPLAYFADLSRYDSPAVALPLIVYRCTLPFRSKAKSEFAYDIMSAESVAVARRSTGMALAAELARIEQLLLASGKPETARLYRPCRREVILAGVERAPRLFHGLLVGDAFFVDSLIHFGVRAGALRRALDHQPQRAMRDLVKCGEDLVKGFQRRLRRLYGGQDFGAFASLILLEATRGLNAGLRSQGRLNGVVRLRVRTRTGEAQEARFVNAGTDSIAAERAA